MGEDRGGGEKKLTSPLTLVLPQGERGIRGGKRKREKVKRKQRKVF
jgi:hypothetical protein